MKRRRRPEPIATRPENEGPVPANLQHSYVASTTQYVQDNIRITSAGLVRDGETNAASFIKSFDELEMVGKLGFGASSSVDKAIHKPTGRIVAVKSLGMAQEHRRQVRAEIDALYQTNHPNLVKTHNTFYHDSTFFIVLEYLDEGSLFDVAARCTRIPELPLAEIALCLLRAINYLHEQGRIHRDIKPQNVCLHSDGRVVMTDFGISREVNGAAIASTFLGTTCYMSPERIMGQSYGKPSDIWAIGCTVLECATGKGPFPSVEGFLDQVQMVTKEPHIDAPDEFSDDFRDFVDKCLAKDPQDRPSAAELLQHRWIQKAATFADFDLSAWLREINEERSRGRSISSSLVRSRADTATADEAPGAAAAAGAAGEAADAC